MRARKFVIEKPRVVSYIEMGTFNELEEERKKTGESQAAIVRSIIECYFELKNEKSATVQA